MNKIQKSFACLIVSSMAIASSAEATSFWSTGKIKRTLTDGRYYSGCMVYLDKAVGNSSNTCPANGWVALDCKGLFNSKEVSHGNRMYTAATSAAMAGKTVSFYINDANKANGYCVAQRIDVIY
jgi:hypothetical protein